MTNIASLELKAFIASGKASIISQIVESIEDMNKEEFDAFMSNGYVSEDNYSFSLGTPNMAGEELYISTNGDIYFSPYLFGKGNTTVTGLYDQKMPIKDRLETRDIERDACIKWNKEYEAFYGVFDEEDKEILEQTLRKKCHETGYKITSYITVR